MKRSPKDAILGRESLFSYEATAMQKEPFRIVGPNRYDIATEVLSSAVRVLQAVGFSEEEIPKLFQQVADKPARGPVWIERL